MPYSVVFTFTDVPTKPTATGSAVIVTRAVQVDSYGAELLGVHAAKTSGAFASAVFTLEHSIDQKNWQTVPAGLAPDGATVTGPGFINRIDARGLRWVRLRLSTAEWTAGTATLTVALHRRTTGIVGSDQRIDFASTEQIVVSGGGGEGGGDGDLPGGLDQQ